MRQTIPGTTPFTILAPSRVSSVVLVSCVNRHSLSISINCTEILRRRTRSSLTIDGQEIEEDCGQPQKPMTMRLIDEGITKRRHQTQQLLYCNHTRSYKYSYISTRSYKQK